MLTLVDGKDDVLHESATLPVKALGTEFCNVSGYRNSIKGALDFMLDGI
ncbi:cytotoxin [Klebsiella pneumoniae]|nr:cytotoxin [Klebsiella pneumoniae]